MPQLPITPAVSPQQPSVGISQTSASAASATEGGDGMEGAPGLNFGAVLSRQLKGIAALPEQKDDVGLSLAADKESVESVAVLPVDLSVLTASMFVPASPVQAGGGDAVNAGKLLMRRDVSELRVESSGISSGAGAENLLTQSPKAGGIRLAAEIAATGKNLPQVASPGQPFADKLAALAEVSAANVGEEFYSVDLSASANPPATTTAVVFRNPELPPLPALPVAPRVGSAEWGGAVGEKVVWMANQSHQVAELHLNPPNLGPIEVRLTISNDQATAMFVSHHSAVREAIETALPRLREMLADNGIMLGNVTVGAESFNQQQQAFDQRNGANGGRGGPEADSVMALIAVPGRPAGGMRDGMVDIFA